MIWFLFIWSQYDPLTSWHAQALTLDLVLDDTSRSRQVPVLVRMGRPEPSPVILFSHGLGGSRNHYAYLATHWTQRGYVTIWIQHPGSDESVWRDLPPSQRKLALTRAASPKNFKLRNQDVHFVLDQMELLNLDPESKLFKSMDLSRIGMAGHSFGAITTQAVSGQKYPFGSDLDERISAALMLSPSPPSFGSPNLAYADVTLPWFLMTGTEDDSPIGQVKAEDRLKIYPHLPAGEKYELVLDDAHHFTFSGRHSEATRDFNPLILAFSTAFWDSHLKEDSEAQSWLQTQALTLLEEEDTWQIK